MGEIISYAFIDEVYAAWVTYLRAHSTAKYFGMSADWTRIAKYPFANFQLIGMPESESDLDGNQVTIRVTFQTMFFVNTEKMSVLYSMDEASGAFFQAHGFHRMGDSVPVRISDSVTAVTSRFTCDNFNGEFI